MLSRGVASPTTYGTALMRLSLALLIVLSSAAAILYIVALGIDQMYVLHNSENVYYTSSVDPAASQQQLLLPQIDATVGLVTACVSGSCFARAGRSGAQGMVATTLGNQSFTSGDASRLQKQLVTEFFFGYDCGLNCGTETKKVERLAEFAYAAFVLSLAFFVGAFISSILFYLLVGNTDLLAGTPSLDRNSSAVSMKELGLSGAYAMLKLQRHLDSEGPLVVAVLVLSGLAFVFSVCAMGVTIAVEKSTSKCGISACESYESSMQSFFAALASLNIAVSPAPAYSCRTGSSLGLSIAGFVLGILCLLLACLLFGWFVCAQRRREMLSVRDQLYRLADVQGLIGTIAGGCGTPYPLAQSQEASCVASTSSVVLSPGGTTGATDIWARAAAKDSTAVRSSVEYDNRQARSVGARIGLYQVLKQFVITEQQTRQGVVARENLEFFSVLAMRETLWYNEELRLLHAFTLSYFVGPTLDLCVLETNARQQILAEYNTVQSAFLNGLTDCFEATEESVRESECGASLPFAESAKWSKQIDRWQKTQRDMAPLILHTASYAQAAASSLQQPQSGKRRKLKATAALKLAALTTSSSTSSSLDTDRWLTIFDKLRASGCDDSAFITHSASPLLVRRNSSGALGFFDEADDTSFSSNVFSDPSFAQTRGEDLTAAPDHIRSHLIRTGYLALTPSPPPPRLRTLPQFDDEKRPANSSSSKCGVRRRRRSGANGSTGRPGERSPSPQARSPARASSLTSAGGWRGDPPSGYGSFQASFAAPNAYAADSSNARAGGGGGNSSGNMSVGGAASAMISVPNEAAQTDGNSSLTMQFPSRGSWRFQKTA